jgi:hypothetical protein
LKKNQTNQTSTVQGRSFFLSIAKGKKGDDHPP